MIYMHGEKSLKKVLISRNRFSIILSISMYTTILLLLAGCSNKNQEQPFDKIILTKSEIKKLEAKDPGIAVRFILPIGTKDGNTGIMRIPRVNEEARYVINPDVKKNPRAKKLYYITGLLYELAGKKNPTPKMVGDLYAVDYNFLVWLAQKAARQDFKQLNTPGKVWGKKNKPEGFTGKFKVTLPRGTEDGRKEAILDMPKAGFHIGRYADPRVKKNGALLPAVTLAGFVESLSGRPFTLDDAKNLSMADVNFLLGMYNKLTLEPSVDFPVRCFNDYTIEKGVLLTLKANKMFKEPLTAKEFPFSLKTGLRDDQGRIFKDGAMRYPLLKDELAVEPQTEKIKKEGKNNKAGGWAKGYGNYEQLDGTVTNGASGPVFDVEKVIAKVITRLGDLKSVSYQQLRTLTAEDRKILKDTYAKASQPPDVTWVCPGRPPKEGEKEGIKEEVRTMPYPELLKRYGYTY
ncbi:MAG: hypothetical protein GXP49_12765 [Deltaproteobacteria bacterium]|nr:hypothetical protein [Deltaproteobacteria bacterium]